MEWHREFQETVQALADTVGAAVVAVGRGAGVVVETSRVVTNAHNVRSPEPEVAFADGRRAAGRLLGADLDADLAVIEVDTGGVVAPPWSEDEPLMGAPVFALANPGGRGLRVTVGTVAALDRSFRSPRGRPVRGAVEHTAPLARGSSGGPIVDAEGKVIGINTHRRDDGFYLAVPSTRLRDQIEHLASGQARVRPRLGIAVAPSEVADRMRAAVGLEERAGLLVRGVDADGPARRAGVRRGDLIIGVDGTPMTTSDELYAALDGLDEGAGLRLQLLRGNEELSVDVSFEEASGD